MLRYRTVPQQSSFVAIICGFVLQGCSVYPIPDDVSPIPTEEIIGSLRCEMRLGLFQQIERTLNGRGISDWTAQSLDEDFSSPKPGKFYEWLKDHIKKSPEDADLLIELNTYGNAAVAYDVDFHVTENNNLDGSLGFNFPFTKGSLDLGLGGSIHKKRDGSRVFSAQETFASAVTRNLWCKGFRPRDRNILYPVTGSIGLDRVVQTFIAIAEQGGEHPGDGKFVDTLTFTTTLSGNANATLKLSAVPNAFRLVSATATAVADRTDTHKIIISLTFPTANADRAALQLKTLREAPAREAGIVPPEDPSYGISTTWRARYNLCVAQAAAREEEFNTLRLTAPEVYCLTYADAFVPRYVNASNAPELLPYSRMPRPRTPRTWLR